MKTFKIADKTIGAGEPVFIIAEAGVNHNGKLDLALNLVDIAAKAGADAVKFQTFTAELLVTEDANQADYQEKNIGKKETQFEMLKRLELKKDDYTTIKKHSQEKGLIFLSSPFSEQDADFLHELDINAYKIPSGEITNIPYLKHIARFNMPMIVSTGMSNMEEVKTAIKAIEEEGNKEIVVLHSTSNYPPSLASLNLKAINTMQSELPYPIGYSDNGSEGVIAEIVSVALGAVVIEKHFTIDKEMEGPDHKASLNPIELTDMVKAIRNTEIVLGDGEKRCTKEEENIKKVARKSLVAKTDIKTGDKFTRENISIKRPGTGMAPKEYESVLGKVAKSDIKADTLLTDKMIS